MQRSDEPERRTGEKDWREGLERRGERVRD
jgi:hypothetical protein